MKKILKLNFHLFDGGGGAEGGAVDASNFDGGFGQTKSPKRTDSKPDLSKVQYGSEGAGAESQVGTDNGQVNEPQEIDLDKELQELVGKDGKYHDAYGRLISKVIQDRFRNQADLQGQVKSYEQAVAPLIQKYGVDAGDIEGLTKAIAGDNDIYRAKAEELGIDVDQYKHNLRLEADAERGRKIAEEYAQQQHRMQMFGQWEAESEVLKQAFPNFDFGRELQTNPRFAEMLDAGLSVREAFVSSRFDDIMSGYGKEKTEQTRANVVSDIKRQAERPPESGMKHSPAAQRKVDPKTFTDADMDEIMRRVESGDYVFRV